LQEYFDRERRTDIAISVDLSLLAAGVVAPSEHSSSKFVESCRSRCDSVN